MPSLQRRIVLGGAIWAVGALAIGGVTLLSVFDTIADRRLNDALNDRLTQIVVALANAGEPGILDEMLIDPAYQRPYSGRYWQINRSDGTLSTSRSLFDADLPIPNTAGRDIEVWSGPGPDGEVRGMSQTITLSDGSEWTVSVAEGLAALQAERWEMRRSLVIAFGLFGAVGIAGAVLIVTAMLRPLRRLGQDISGRWDSGREIEADDYPHEIAPLVNDINLLLQRNRDVIAQGRRQAADLAHALKTPAAALRNEIAVMKGAVDDTAPLLAALDRIDAQINRSLGRMRAEHASKAVGTHADLHHSARRLERLFTSLPEMADKSLSVRVPRGLSVAADAQDIEEMLGNIIENAMKWCDGQLAVSAVRNGDWILLVVEDDGPGIAPRHRREVLEEGARLDTSVPGTGIGLSITRDLAQAYGGSMDLTRSEILGGLKVVIRLPVPGARGAIAPHEHAPLDLSGAG